MSHSWLTLTDDEEIVWTEHPSLYTHLGQVVLGLVLVVVGIAIARSDALQTDVGIGTLGSVLGLALMVVGAVVAVVGYLRRTTTVYVLTTKHVYQKVGILRREVDPVRLDRVADMEYSQSLVERLLNIGDVHIMTAGTGGKDMVLEDVPAVQEFVDRLSRQLDRQSGSGAPDRERGTA